MIPNCIKNKQKHKELENKITSAVSNKVKYKTLVWGKSISLKMDIGGMGIAMFGHSALYLLWRNGGGFAYKCIAGGSDINISVSADNSTITFSGSGDFAMTIFYTNGS